MQRLVVALGLAHQFERDVGNDLVGIHVGRSAGAALNGVDHELVVEVAIFRNQLAGPVDGIGLGRRQMPETFVGARRCLFHQRQCPDQIRKMTDGNAGDREIVHGPQGVDAPIGIGGHVGFAEQVVFASRRDLGQFD